MPLASPVTNTSRSLVADELDDGLEGRAARRRAALGWRRSTSSSADARVEHGGRGAAKLALEARVFPRKAPIAGGDLIRQAAPADHARQTTRSGDAAVEVAVEEAEYLLFREANRRDQASCAAAGASRAFPGPWRQTRAACATSLVEPGHDLLAEQRWGATLARRQLAPRRMR
jgi:hypothetical protein